MATASGSGSRNSVKFVNHNSADLYTYDPATGDTRYERHLFSQDAGDPVVADGLLFWPFEDARWSPGRGEFMVTDGRRWRWAFLRAGRAFHIHAMTRHRGALFAALSAWRARIQRSDDGGATWRQVFEYPSPERAVSRITALATLNGTLHAGLTTWYDSQGPKLLRWQEGRFAPVAGWPSGAALPALTRYRGWLYGRNLTEEGSAIWRTDGRRVERIGQLDRHDINDLAAGKDALWAVSSRAGDGTLWRSADGVRWERVQDLPRIQPIDVAIYGGRIYVGGQAGDGGVLLGPPAPAPVEAGTAPAPLPRAPVRPAAALAGDLARLDAVLRRTRGVRWLARGGATRLPCSMTRRRGGH